MVFLAPLTLAGAAVAAPLTQAQRTALFARVEPARIQADTDGNRLFDNLEAQMTAARVNQPLKVIVRYKAGREAAVLSGLGGRAARRLTADQSVATCLTRDEIRRLVASGAVESVEADVVCKATRETAQASYGVTKARADFSLTGNADGNAAAFSAADLTIAVIDTGIDGGHQDFTGGKIIAWRDFVNSRTTPYDDDGHGTHCASIAAGKVNAGGIGGVAPGASLVGLKVLGAGGTGDSSVIIQAIDWCITNKVTHGIDVINLSLDSSGPSDGSDALSRAVNRAVAAGMVVCVSAGNEGPELFTIGSPGAAEDAITVGNMLDVGEGGFALWYTSSRGPTADGRTKPDVCAPGVQIDAAKANTGNGYVPATGTSLATPFVAGVAALMRQADPSLNPYQVKDIIKQTAVRFGRNYENNDFGSGRLDAYRALALAAHNPGTPPAVPGHLELSGHLNGPNSFQVWDLPVNSTAFPIALTLITEHGGTDLDLMVLDPEFNVLTITGNDGRQALASFEPTRTGLYQVRVNCFQGGGEYSLDASGGFEMPTPPAAPTNLTATGASRTQINLTWTDNSGSETAFAIFRRSGADDFDRIAVVDRNTTSYADLELRPGTRYTYRIRAIGPSGASPWSNVASGLTLPEEPLAPTNLTASATSATQVNLTWRDNSSDEAAYGVYRKTATTDWVRIGGVGANVTSYADLTANAGTTYTYRVRAGRDTMVSGWSNEATVTTP
jgi:serine protease AprX